ncbi:MAG TPA: type III polyketide synthase, partial [Phycisphaerae bacterium]|nr:type III polyketide synthase [Phycisphaerae bacterium]
TPEYSLGPADSVELFRKTGLDPRLARMLPRIVKLTEIERRHLVVMEPKYAPYGEEALYREPTEQPNGPGMGARMALFDKTAGDLVQRALASFDSPEMNGVQALVTASCTHASAPGLERPIFARTAIRPTVDRWNLGFMGCSAGLAGLRLIHQMAARSKECLLVACELCSLHFQYTSRLDQLTANVLFADGAAAVLVSPRPSAVRVLACECASIPSKADQMVWSADDHGLRLELSQELPDTLAGEVPRAVAAFLDRAGCSLREIDHWLVHPGGPQILDSVQNALALPTGALDRSRGVLRRHGNMSSPTIFFILRELIESGAKGRALAMAFGPGLTMEMVLLEVGAVGR